MQKIRIKKIFASATFGLLILLPVFAYAAPTTDPSVNTKAKTGITYECQTTDPATGLQVYGNCNIDDVISEVNKLVDFGRNIGLGFSIIVIVYAGVLYLMSEGKPAELAKVNKMFVKIGYGIFFILAAWVIVHLITNSLLSPEVQKLVPVTN